MEIAKNYRINSLFEFYEPLLTNKQKSYIQLYYGDDYSLGEIAAEFAVSRQAVYDNIKRTEKILEDYETKLHLYQAFVARNHQVDAISDYIKKSYHGDAHLLKMIQQLVNLEADSE
ncbi:putative DNA-binding protein [Lactobacillus sp. CBA3606]|uniref:putative DNA-binding protein n=1 Tax=unclassified Lactobacillus TaxID=2620435 RepID=UPI000CFDFC30|nr:MULTISPECIES: putative DNA-binding protein [unclassified Lactobacillus]AVK60310.1 putative DNA-binding protein [Lactobacillus sp. CBA3605]AVK62958.1 putative DNA-binding protein [Lactobacillus sp. CBA3606]